MLKCNSSYSLQSAVYERENALNIDCISPICCILKLQGMSMTDLLIPSLDYACFGVGGPKSDRPPKTCPGA